MIPIADEPMWLDASAPDATALAARFRWQVPARFNIARDVCLRHAAVQPDGVALRFEDADRAAEAYTWRWFDRESARFANTLAALGARPGDRVAVVLPERPETAAA
ncbi:MAG: AMP-binding protein, partial [Burkholderiales bacterium]|nr:AMP-binding protein [Burkholderiales bacterium]